MNNFVIKRIASRRIAARNLRAQEYESAPANQQQRLLLQLKKFNNCWQRIQHNVKFYQRLVKNKTAPKRFESWEQFLSCIPVVNRQTVQQYIPELTGTTRPPDFYRTTGGTTAKPIQLPAWNSEILYTDPDVWLARKWYAIEPDTPLFLLWGHSHLLGTGFKGWVNGRLRELKDYILGYTRFSAYDLSADAMRKAGRSLKKSKAEYIIGYSVALDRFARVNENAGLSRPKSLKVVIGAAEAFPFDDSVVLLNRVFGAPVAMEYGSDETGLMAHTVPKGGYRVFWLSYFLEAMDKGPRAGRVLRITSLYPRCFPLLRYEIGDEIDIKEATIGVTSFAKVLGRCDDYLEIRNGERIHWKAIAHCVKDCKGISGYQMVKDKNCLTLKVITHKNLSPIDKQQILQRLSKIDTALSQTQIVEVDALEQTVAGKTPMILCR